MFTFKLAHRCVTRDASDTILGAGWASAGYDAATIDSRLRGVGYLIAETDKPRRMRSYHLADQDIRLVVEQALELRGQER
jgi:hypothetical protein